LQPTCLRASKVANPVGQSVRQARRADRLWGFTLARYTLGSCGDSLACRRRGTATSHQPSTAEYSPWVMIKIRRHLPFSPCHRIMIPLLAAAEASPCLHEQYNDRIGMRVRLHPAATTTLVLQGTLPSGFCLSIRSAAECGNPIKIESEKRAAGPVWQRQITSSMVPYLPVSIVGSG
jgi:hypothetical protein